MLYFLRGFVKGIIKRHPLCRHLSLSFLSSPYSSAENCRLIASFHHFHELNIAFTSILQFVRSIDIIANVVDSQIIIEGKKNMKKLAKTLIVLLGLVFAIVISTTAGSAAGCNHTFKKTNQLCKTTYLQKDNNQHWKQKWYYWKCTKCGYKDIIEADATAENHSWYQTSVKYNQKTNVASEYLVDSCPKNKYAPQLHHHYVYVDKYSYQCSQCKKTTQTEVNQTFGPDIHGPKK